MPEEIKPERPKRNKRRIYKIITFSVILLLILIGIGAYLYIQVHWYVGDTSPGIVLLHPSNHQVINNNTTYFLWNSTDIDGDTLSHVYYIDTWNTFISPYVRTVSVGALENYTPLPFMDGDYYWRVEVTDGKYVNVSETWHVIFQNDTTNHFPNLTYPSVSPNSGTTATVFTYQVTFNDADNDTADYVRVYIDNNMFNMTEYDASDTNTTDGKIYRYSTTLGVGSHNYSFTCSDGTAINISSLYLGPTVTTAPVTPPPSGGTGGTGDDTKMNKVTIQPQNTEAFPGYSFRGNIVITEENYENSYEVYWYLYLLDENDTLIGMNSGSLAIQSSVVVSYKIPLNNSVHVGHYKLLAKTYDNSRDKITANQLGMDEILVEIVEKAPGSEIIKEIQENDILLYILIAFAVILPLIAWRRKEGLYIVFALGILMILLLVFNVVSMHFWSFIAIILLMFGLCCFVKKTSVYLPVKREQYKILIGGVLIFIAIILYFLPVFL